MLTEIDSHHLWGLVFGLSLNSRSRLFPFSLGKCLALRELRCSLYIYSSSHRTPIYPAQHHQSLPISCRNLAAHVHQWTIVADTEGQFSVAHPLAVLASKVMHHMLRFSTPKPMSRSAAIAVVVVVSLLLSIDVDGHEPLEYGY